MNTSKAPWWFPKLCDEAYFSQLREDYPERARMTDEELQDYFDHGNKYSTLWDHIGEAYSDYEPLADSFLELLESLEDMVVTYKREADIGNPYINISLLKARAAISRARGDDHE